MIIPRLHREGVFASMHPQSHGWEDVCAWVLGSMRCSVWDALVDAAFVQCVHQRIDGWMDEAAAAVLEPMHACFQVC